MNEQETRRWTVHDAAELYEVAGWGKGYFSVNEAGNVCVHPDKDPQQKIDLKQLVDQLRARQIELPVLIRFGGRAQATVGGDSSRVPGRHQRAAIPGHLPVRLPDQGQPAAAGGGGDRALRPGATTSGWRPAASRNCSPWRPSPATTRPSSATASRTRSSSSWRCWPRSSAARCSSSWRSTPNWS